MHRYVIVLCVMISGSAFLCSGMSELEHYRNRVSYETEQSFKQAADRLKSLSTKWRSELKEFLETQGLVKTCEQRIRCYSGCSSFNLEHNDAELKDACDRMQTFVDGISEQELSDIEAVSKKISSGQINTITHVDITCMNATIQHYCQVKDVEMRLEATAKIWETQMKAMVAIKQDKEKKCIVM